MRASGEKDRGFSQLYLIDSAKANLERLNHPANVKLNPSLLEDLDYMLREINIYAKLYKMLGEVEKEETEKALLDDQEIPAISMIFNRDRNSDRRRYNEPTTDEVAMIFRSTDGAPPFERDFRVYPMNPDDPNNAHIKLNILSPHLDPMIYVLFYPHGEPGWQPNIELSFHDESRVRKKVSMLKWKASQLAVRENEFNPILYGEALFQQWAVDSYCQAEANNLNYVKFQQKKLRVEQYRGLMDHLNDVAAEEGIAVGRKVILPTTFQGSPRNLREKYHDAMAMVVRYGKPDLFITMTCNPKWMEFEENCFDGQEAQHRPDLIARIFKIKLKAVLNDIIKNKLFGKIIAYFYTIEFQKRGLPHAHMLFILDENNKIDTADKIDQFMCAEIPEVELEPKLHEIVVRTMLHGPCGSANRNSPCMSDNKCSKNFPKNFSESTIIEVNGYPSYRRRKGVTFEKGDFVFDNRHVVPYNKYLTLKYNCHINVESCQSIKAIKYIFKYIYKGHDCASINIRDKNNNLVHDEINQFLDARYVCAPEAIWRLFEYQMHDRSHAVIRLAVHLPQEQLVYFEEGQEMQAVARTEEKFTHLTAWFELNKINVEARQFLYPEIPFHFVFQSKTSSWKRRERGSDKIIPRMYHVVPKDVERYYLRMLLQHIRGAQSFQDLKTVNGKVCETFKATAIERKLLEDDTEWISCLEEASAFSMPQQLRQIFAFICIFNSPKEPLHLFDNFKEFFIEDFRREFSEICSEMKALQDIDSILRLHGLQCSDFNLPTPAPVMNFEHVYDQRIEQIESAAKIASLNERQLEIFNEVINMMETDSTLSRCVFIDGPGGSGKTFLYNALLGHLRGQGKIALAFATTGIAADLLKGGQTAHSGFKIPIVLNETSVSSMKTNSQNAKRIHNASLLIIDETSMLSIHSLRVIDQLLKEIMNNNRPFGGKVLILGGDFRQTANIVPHGTVTDIIEMCIKNSQLWSHVTRRSLITNMRSSGEENFNAWLLKVGNGNEINKHIELDKNLIEIPKSMLIEENIVAEIFGRQLCFKTATEVLETSKKIILTSKNDTAAKLNEEILNLIIDTEEKSYESIDSMIIDDIDDSIDFPIEFLNQQCPSGMPPHLLKLKIGAFIMLLRNLNSKRGLLNGTRLIIKSLHKNFIGAEIISGSNKGEEVFIPRIILEPSEASLPFKMRRIQFPIILAFAMTINKSQGQSFEHVGVFLPEPVFAHGQLYVALSRTKNSKNLKVLALNTLNQGKLLPPEHECLNESKKTFTMNVVYKELLE